jgi:hypothetical protein
MKYLYNLASNRLDNSIPRLEDIIRVLVVNIVVVKEEVIKDIEHIKDIIKVIEA